MKDNSNLYIESVPKSNTLSQLGALIKWSLLRHKTLLPVFTVMQAVLSFAIVYGLALLIPDIDHVTSIYLSSGAATLGIIAVGCVLAAQIINTAKQDGVVQYQKTLPVSRVNILLADFFIWGAASLPGVLMSFLASYIRFGIAVRVSLSGVILLILTQTAMISIGFAIAYWLSPNAVGLVTQVIMIGGLLFSPITYPAERLPEWMQYIYNFLPFIPTSNLIRGSFFQMEEILYRDIFVVFSWTVMMCLLSLWALSRRD
ncbi:ABC-2 type transporter [Enterococcus faecalis 13-SD-W-01]|nr:ABC-2 type transporter [Enterococcus faecalis 13-SD-W-01]